MYLSDRPRPGEPGAGGSGRGGRVARTVVLLGFVSLLTDVSSEATASVLPLYLTTVLGLSPLAYGLVDGLYQGASVVVRLAGGWLSDRTDRPKWIAVVGYGLSAVARLALLPVAALGGILAVVTADRLGKGLRTAPRDALIAASTEPHMLGRAFGVHRALDTTGAVLGPLARVRHPGAAADRLRPPCSSPPSARPSSAWRCWCCSCQTCARTAPRTRARSRRRGRLSGCCSVGRSAGSPARPGSSGC